jgi:hypothetical protein
MAFLLQNAVSLKRGVNEIFAEEDTAHKMKNVIFSKGEER